MNKAQRDRFQRAGWKVRTVVELLDLSPAEEALIETPSGRTADPRESQKLLGHSSVAVAVTMKYAHLARDFMRDEIGRLRFERILAKVSDLAEHMASVSG
jgi:hypothetical protein